MMRLRENVTPPEWGGVYARGSNRGVVTTSSQDLNDLANQINVAFQKSQNYRVTAGKHLLEAQRRVQVGEAGEITWEQWLRKNIKRSPGDCRKCMALARGEDPETAAAAERTKAREAMRRHRANVSAADPLKALLAAWNATPEDDRRRFLAIVSPHLRPSPVSPGRDDYLGPILSAFHNESSEWAVT
jgi:hypothetical protein